VCRRDKLVQAHGVVVLFGHKKSMDARQPAG
jgi:hypothetical protein